MLLFFHGMGNLGYRERLTDDKSRGPAGSVHDVEADRMEQQLAHSGRNIVGVLPQGTNAATFGIADPQAYVTEVLAKAAAKLSVPAITSGRIIVSGHSGGGRPAVAAATKLTATAPTTDDEWFNQPPLFLFDGINGPNEANAIGDLMDKWLDADLVRLKASSDPVALLNRRAIKLRSTHTSSDLYTATNLGGKYDTEVPDGVDENDKPKTKTVSITDRAGTLAEGPHRRLVRKAQDRARARSRRRCARSTTSRTRPCPAATRPRSAPARWRPTRRSATPLRPG